MESVDLLLKETILITSRSKQYRVRDATRKFSTEVKSTRGGAGQPPIDSELCKLVAVNDFHAVKKLIGMGEDVNCVVKKPSGALLTALSTAIEDKNIAIVQLLLDNGAKFDDDYPTPARPLRHAALNPHFGIVQLLLDRGAKVNALSGGCLGSEGPNERQFPLGTAIYEVAKQVSTRIVKELLRYGADPRVQA